VLTGSGLTPREEHRTNAWSPTDVFSTLRALLDSERTVFSLSFRVYSTELSFIFQKSFNRGDISLASLRKRIKFGPEFVRPEAIVQLLLLDRSSDFYISFKKSATYQLMPFFTVRI
jgi:hypothetical protein